MKPFSKIPKAGRFFRLLYLKLFRIDDTPQKIAAGFGLGVFSGVLPGTGPIAALFLAFIFRVNRAAALVGSLITNTWISIPLFLLSLRIGSAITGGRHHDIVTILTGYLVISACIGLICYAAALAILKKRDSGLDPWTVLSIVGAIFFFILMRAHIFNIPMIRDEGEYAYSAWLLRHDIAPYRYAFLQKPPMIIYTYALAQLISPVIYWIPKILDYSFVACATVLLGLTVRAEFGPAAGLIAAWLFIPMAMLPGAAQFTANVEHFMLLPLMAMLFMYVRDRGKAAPRHWCLAGAFAGIAVMYKYTVLPVAAFIFAAWAADTWRQRQDAGGLSRRAASGAAGMLLAAAAALAYFIARGAMPQLWECTVAFNAHYFKWDIFGGIVPFLSRGAAFFSHWWALFILAGYFLVRRPPRWLFYALLLAVGVAVSCGSVHGHYYIILMPFWAIVCAAALDILSKDIARRAGVNLNLIRTLIVALVLVSMHLLIRPPFMAGPAGTEAERFMVRGYSLESMDIARRLKGMTADGDLVFVAGSEPQILYYARRMSPTRFITMYPLMIPGPTASRYQEEVIRALKEHPPRVIVLVKHADSWAFTAESPNMIWEYMTGLLNSGDYELAGGYIERDGVKNWKDAPEKGEIRESSLLLFRRKGGII